MSVEHFVPYQRYTPRYMQFSGRVYDGPLEGLMHTEKGRDWFFLPVLQPSRLSALDFDPTKVPEMARVYQGYYFWSEPLHAWVFDWRSIAS